MMGALYGGLSLNIIAWDQYYKSFRSWGTVVNIATNITKVVVGFVKVRVCIKGYRVLRICYIEGYQRETP